VAVAPCLRRARPRLRRVPAVRVQAAHALHPMHEVHAAVAMGARMIGSASRLRANRCPGTTAAKSWSMARTVLVTGGAGFIGSHLCDRLLADGQRVRVLDNLSVQVHGARIASGRGAVWPAGLSRDVELLVGDVRDLQTCRRALEGADAVVHLAARVGVGQSMYEPAEYTSVNNLGTATLLEAMARRPIERLVVASSMSIYGEGRYVDEQGTAREPLPRRNEELLRRDFSVRDREGRSLSPMPTDEEKNAVTASVYALSKLDQERLCLILGQAYGIEAVALRLFNVYGPRQALSNPYTGVMAIFSTRLLHDRPPLINEDGQQMRDFVNVHDVVEAFALALQRPGLAGRALNIGSGSVVTVAQIADRLGRALDKTKVIPQVTGQYRVGDIRHCFADISRARSLLGFTPRVRLDEGLTEWAGWVAEGPAAEDHVELARQELTSRGLAL
jgi:dTDP-L-rhamnose 4-epimerase